MDRFYWVIVVALLAAFALVGTLEYQDLKAQEAEARCKSACR